MPAPGEHLSFDEGMGRFFGRVIGLKKHMPNKPIKEGLKFFVGVDYEMGFCFDFNMADGNPIDLIEGSEAGLTGHSKDCLVSDTKVTVTTSTSLLHYLWKRRRTTTSTWWGQFERTVVFIQRSS